MSTTIEQEIDLFARLGAREWGISEDQARVRAHSLLRREGEIMLRRMVVWLHDPGGRESPEETRRRFVDFMTNPENKDWKML